MNPGGPILELGYTDDYVRCECLTCGTVFKAPLGIPAICPHCSGLAGIPARIWARFTRLMHRINDLDSMYYN